ncbi:MAG: hypothetical protein AAGB46_01870 [Verrucomicrobiota bacterium]
MKSMRIFVLAIVYWAMPLSAVAQGIQSPFEYPKAKPRTTQVVQASVLDNYEFRGVSRLDGETKVFLMNSNEGKGLWLIVGERDGDSGMLARNYDSDRDSIVVQHGTKTKTLSLARSEITAIKTSPVPAAATTAKNNPQVSQGGPEVRRRTVPESDEEVRARMQKVAEEIRKRRQMRRSVIEEGAPDRR